MIFFVRRCSNAKMFFYIELGGECMMPQIMLWLQGLFFLQDLVLKEVKVASGPVPAETGFPLVTEDRV